MEKVNDDVVIEEPTEAEAEEGQEAVQTARTVRERRTPRPMSAEEMQRAAEEAANAVKRGKLTLAEPITDGEEEYTELVYDFSLLKGLEVARALDFGDGPRDSFRLNDVQALNYFACAAAKCQEIGGLDATDIRERIGGMDAIKAIQIATLFFRASSRAGDLRLSKI